MLVFLYAFCLSQERLEPVRDRRTDGRTDKICNALFLLFSVFYNWLKSPKLIYLLVSRLFLKRSDKVGFNNSVFRFRGYSSGTAWERLIPLNFVFDFRSRSV